MRSTQTRYDNLPVNSRIYQIFSLVILMFLFLLSGSRSIRPVAEN